jgi:hypothetical protein
MSNEAVIKGINSAIDLIQNFLPLVPVVGPASPLINKIIDTLQDIAPLIEDQVGVSIEGIKNIIKSLSKNPGTSAEQLATLQALDKRVDDAWDAIEGELDPDK